MLGEGAGRGRSLPCTIVKGVINVGNTVRGGEKVSFDVDDDADDVVHNVSGSGQHAQRPTFLRHAVTRQSSSGFGGFDAQTGGQTQQKRRFCATPSPINAARRHTVLEYVSTRQQIDRTVRASPLNDLFFFLDVPARLCEWTQSSKITSEDSRWRDVRGHSVVETMAATGGVE